MTPPTTTTPAATSSLLLSAGLFIVTALASQWLQQTITTKKEKQLKEKRKRRQKQRQIELLPIPTRRQQPRSSKKKKQKKKKYAIRDINGLKYDEDSSCTTSDDDDSYIPNLNSSSSVTSSSSLRRKSIPTEPRSLPIGPTSSNADLLKEEEQQEYCFVTEYKSRRLANRLSWDSNDHNHFLPMEHSYPGATATATTVVETKAVEEAGTNARQPSITTHNQQQIPQPQKTKPSLLQHQQHSIASSQKSHSICNHNHERENDEDDFRPKNSNWNHFERINEEDLANGVLPPLCTSTTETSNKKKKSMAASCHSTSSSAGESISGESSCGDDLDDEETEQEDNAVLLKQQQQQQQTPIVKRSKTKERCSIKMNGKTFYYDEYYNDEELSLSSDEQFVWTDARYHEHDRKQLKKKEKLRKKLQLQQQQQQLQQQQQQQQQEGSHKDIPDNSNDNDKQRKLRKSSSMPLDVIHKQSTIQTAELKTIPKNNHSSSRPNSDRECQNYVVENIAISNPTAATTTTNSNDSNHNTNGKITNYDNQHPWLRYDNSSSVVNKLNGTTNRKAPPRRQMTVPAVLRYNTATSDDNSETDKNFHHGNRVIARAHYNATIMPCKVVLVRHGQSMGNVNQSLFATTPDNAMPLTKLGWEQARAAGKQLKENILLNTTTNTSTSPSSLPPTTRIKQQSQVHFIVSPYVRTVETFHGMVSAWCDPDKEFGHIENLDLRRKAWYGKLLELGLTWQEDPRIREQDFGNYQDPETIQKAKKDRHGFGAFYYRFPSGGESASDVYDRVSTFLDSLWRSFDMNRTRNYVLITHGIAIRVLLARYFRYTIPQFNMLSNPKNCEMIQLGHDGYGKLQLEGRYELNFSVTKKVISNTTKEKKSLDDSCDHSHIISTDQASTTTISTSTTTVTNATDNSTNSGSVSSSTTTTATKESVPHPALEGDETTETILENQPNEKDENDEDEIITIKGYAFHKRLRVLPQKFIKKVNIRISYNG